MKQKTMSQSSKFNKEDMSVTGSKKERALKKSHHELMSGTGSKREKSLKKSLHESASGASSKSQIVLRKSPDESVSPKNFLKTVPKNTAENCKSGRDSDTKVPVLSKKKAMTQLTSQDKDSQLVAKTPKAGLDSVMMDEDKPETTSTKILNNSSEASQSEKKKMQDPRGYGPFFYIGGGNGAHLISAYCTNKGWQQILDPKREDYKLKWCELKSASSYSSFHEGKQLLYQIPNNKVLTTKIGLLTSLREYERIMQKINKAPNHRVLQMEDFIPETFRLDLKDEREKFFSLYKEDQTWICKPTGLNQGRGIFLLKTPEEFVNLQFQQQALNDESMSKKIPNRRSQARIVQRYIGNPLLLDGRKFDVRAYLLIASTIPYFVFFRHGYVRLTCNNYDPKSDDLTGHLTNQYMQKKNPLYSELKNETVWGMERFNSYVNEHFATAKGLPQNWVLTTFTKRIQQIMTHCFLAVKSKLECRLGYFDLIGCDFLIDEDFKVWLLEMNCNPSLNTNCEVLKDVVPNVVNETLDLTLEIFYKTLKSQSIKPLNTESSFILLYNTYVNEQTGRSKSTASPIRKLKASLKNASV
ncbi:inactive polyglycylase TTLL10 [Bombina bombina]|uniref:inactive polyglycylase TTLL10 n=1 Tax=Bombina bombina TaxID=8345 RepID=UPI00235AD6EC|nr:inactive polyglycylase TTLL10 [Bombina bombina]